MNKVIKIAQIEWFEVFPGMLYFATFNIDIRFDESAWTESSKVAHINRGLNRVLHVKYSVIRLKAGIIFGPFSVYWTKTWNFKLCLFHYP